jgi:hypothetical protein
MTIVFEIIKIRHCKGVTWFTGVVESHKSISSSDVSEGVIYAFFISRDCCGRGIICKVSVN